MVKKEVIIESIRHGAYIKVIAIDPQTGIEATIVGDPAVGTETLNNLAIQKLEYVLSKRQSKT